MNVKMPKLLNHLNIKTFNHLFAYLQISRFRHSVVAGVSLFEIIIVVGIFAIVAVLTTRATLLTLTGSRKSETGIKAKQNLENALSVIERAVKNADTVTTPCGVNPPRVDFTDSDGLSAYFSCEALQTSGYIASGSAKGITPLTGSEIVITDCSFTCTA